MDFGPLISPLGNAMLRSLRPAGQVRTVQAFPPARTLTVGRYPVKGFAVPGPAGPPNPYVQWLVSIGLSCYRWNSLPDIERRLLVATQRFRNYQMFLNGSPQVRDFVGAVNAACATVPVTVVYKTHPAGQATAPTPAPQAVTVNSQCRLVDSTTGTPLTDSNGNPIQYQCGGGRGREMLMGFLCLVAVIGLPTYFGSYFGARAGMGK